MRLGSIFIVFLFSLLIIACSTATPTVAPAPTLVQSTPTAVVAPIAAATPTVRLSINLITPLPPPTDVPATATVVVTSTLEAGGGGLPAEAPELGTSSADAALVAILQRCWQLSDPRLLDGNNTQHIDAFNCARASLALIAQQFPAYALVHRVIAWGYIYKDNNLAQAIQEYTQAAALYKAARDQVGESESRMRLGVLLTPKNKGQGCSEIGLATQLNPSNDRAAKYYSDLGCGGSGSTAGGASGPAPIPSVSLDAVRGKILFQSDRGGVDSYYVMDIDGSNQKQVGYSVYAAAMRWEAWSPDHSMVAAVRNEGYTLKFGDNNDIWVTDPSGGSGRALANPANDYDPAWSPGSLYDGFTSIAFVSNRGDIAHGNAQGEEIWLMHPDGNKALRLTCHGPNYSKHPSWSSDASRLVFYSNYPNGGNSQIYVIDLTGLGTASDPCQVGETAKNLSNNSYNDVEPIWVK